MDPLPVRDPTLWVVAFEVDDVFGYSKGKIDVYAKPMTTGVSWPVETHEKRPSRIKKKAISDTWVVAWAWENTDDTW